VGACTSVCTYVAHLLCAMPRHTETPDPAIISNRVISACMHWKIYIDEWQSIRTALKNNFFLRMAIVGRDRCITPHATHRARNTHLNVLDELQHPNFLDEEDCFQGEPFAQPVCALFCDGTYSYMVCKMFRERKGELEYFFFDPHGQTSLIKGFDSAEDCAKFLRKHCDLYGGTKKTWDWNWILCTRLPPSTYRELEKAHKDRSTSKRKKRK